VSEPVCADDDDDDVDDDDGDEDVDGDADDGVVDADDDDDDVDGTEDDGITWDDAPVMARRRALRARLLLLRCVRFHRTACRGSASVQAPSSSCIKFPRCGL
jgi:hypothetical protein